LLLVAGSWVSVTAGLIPLGLVISLSPLSIIPAVLVLQAPRPRPSSLAFLGGWLSGLIAVTALSVAASGALGGMHKSPPHWVSWVRVVLGSLLIVFGIVRWLTRKRESGSPRWMRSFASISPPRAGITGLVLAVVRPDVSLLCVAAGLAIGSGRLEVAGVWVCVAIFVVVAASSVAIPIVAYLGAGERLDEPLARLKNWMEQNDAALTAVVLLVIGLMVLYNGIHALS